MSQAEERQRYCHSCGTRVAIYTMISPEGEVDRCQVCNSVISDEELKIEHISLGMVYVVEDTALLREMIKDILLVRGLAQNVQGCVNGAEFLSYYTVDLIKKSPPGLVMLDVVMPVMNGINAAVAMRAVERAFGKHRTPILFFTVKQCDEAFRKVLRFCTPAMYINKGTESSPAKMKARVEAVVAKLWKEFTEGE